MKPVYFLLPHTSVGEIKPIARWLASLPELSLLAPIETVEISWQQAVTGDSQDWIKTMQAIHEHWDDAQGFVVWAPQASLLELAGSASLIFQKAGKPIIFFASDYPKTSAKSADLVAIKSTLINACYIACADLGEVGVLIGQSLHRPSACEWGKGVSGQTVISSQPPLATIDFRLHLQGDYLRRTDEVKMITQPRFEKSLGFLAWHPGAQTDLHPSKDTQAIMVSAESAYWPHRDMQQFRKSMQSTELPLIWFSQQPWPEQLDWHKNEIGVSHDHAWWAALVSQFAFGSRAKDRKPLQLIQQLIHP